MTNQYSRPGNTAELRRKAEEIARNTVDQRSSGPEFLSSAEALRMLHELRVHQIEVELQNEELRLAYDALEERVEERTAALQKANTDLRDGLAERQRVEDMLRHVARLYAMLSQINQAVVRTREEDELFRLLCAVAVEHGRFRMAWVGLADEVAHRITPQAHAGCEDGYLSGIVISTGDTATGNGPTGSAFRDGEIAITHDIATDPRMRPWRDEALKRGYRSSAAVPFRRKGKLSGVFSLYAAEPGFFTADDKRLLQEIGEAISFALDAMASELSLLRKDGSRVGVFSSHSIVRIPGGAPEFFCLDIDITARSEAEAALRESEAQNRALISAIPDLIFTNRRDGEFVSVHASDPSMLFVAPEIFLHRKIGEIMPQPIADQFMNAFAHACDSGAMQVVNYALPVKDGERLFEARVVPRTEGTVISIVRDVTDHKRAEAEKERLVIQNRHLQKSESLGRMACAIAHHFNNQLHAVMMSLELARDNLPPGADPVEGLSEAMQSARKAAEMSTLMLTYLGQSHFTRDRLDLSEVCRRSLSLLRAEMPRATVLETNLPAPGPNVDACANQIQQILTNLITNAWEASGDQPGVIRLAVKTVGAAEVSATNRFPIDWQPRDPAYACLEVWDTGAGIPAADIEKVFDPFFSSKFVGRGLGLPVVLGIARAHDGVVTVGSELGRGSVFRVFLPLAADAAR